MGHYPFTLFNIITALVMAVTVLLLWRRVRGATTSNWPLVYYAILAAYAMGFSGSMNPYWVGLGAACGIGIRLEYYPRLLRWPETAALAYVVWRCVALLAMW